MTVEQQGYDLASVKARIAEEKQEMAEANGEPEKKPQVYTFADRLQMTFLFLFVVGCLAASFYYANGWYLFALVVGFGLFVIWNIQP